jgi:ISXO2-like transposase domain
MHNVINHAEKYVDGQIHTNGIKNFWSLLKRTIGGTYVSVLFHLFRYLDDRSDSIAAKALALIDSLKAVVNRRIAYAELTGKVQEPEGA